jgi:hypothetical protein
LYLIWRISFSPKRFNDFLQYGNLPRSRQLKRAFQSGHVFPGRKIGDIADKMKLKMTSKGFGVANERSSGADVAGASTFNDTADISPVRSFC